MSAMENEHAADATDAADGIAESDFIIDEIAYHPTSVRSQMMGKYMGSVVAAILDDDYQVVA